MLADEDVDQLAGGHVAGSTLGGLIWEEPVGPAPFASAARRLGGQLLATGGFPFRAIMPRSRRENNCDGRR